MLRSPRVLAVVGASLALFVASCGSSSSTPTATSTSGSPSSSTTGAAGTPSLTGTITVSAASSLTEGFTQIGKDFEAGHPGTHVKFSFDASSTLVTQIKSGAPADVFASADQKNMTVLTDAGLVQGTPTVFAHNRLEIITKPGNPLHIKTLADLAHAGVISLCGATVPCGKFAAQVLKAAGVTIAESSITRGTNAKATLAAVAQGDAVAGIVYVTDAKAASTTVAAVPIPDAQNAVAAYPVGVLKASKNASLAQAFVAAVLAPAGQATLKELGFLAP